MTARTSFTAATRSSFDPGSLRITTSAAATLPAHAGHRVPLSVLSGSPAAGSSAASSLCSRSAQASAPAAA